TSMVTKAPRACPGGTGEWWRTVPRTLRRDRWAGCRAAVAPDRSRVAPPVPAAATPPARTGWPPASRRPGARAARPAPGTPPPPPHRPRHPPPHRRPPRLAHPPREEPGRRRPHRQWRVRQDLLQPPGPLAGTGRRPRHDPVPPHRPVARGRRLDPDRTRPAQV